jgi:DNA-binding transcriptional ArsR family regulator
MQISELRDELGRRLADFLWSQWGQMGVLGGPGRRDHWAADPEALLLLSFEVGRGEPRLFDQILDWLALNERLISVQRLRNLVRDEADRALVEAVLGWLGKRRRRARLEAKTSPGERLDQPEPFFHDSQLSVGDPDPAFLAQGFLKAASEPSRNSQHPDLNLPINFAFRLRALLGVGVRAEVIRVLLSAQAPRVNVQVIAASTAYTKRNVQEALNSLRSAGVVDSSEIGNEQRFAAPQDHWLGFLELRELPRHEDWPQLFAAYRLLLRWLADPANEELSEYMLASEARQVLEAAGEDLRFAGVPVNLAGPAGAEYWSHFASSVRDVAPPQ